MPPQATEHSFDELARGLASGSVTRGKALRLMGAALVGGTLTSFGIGGVAVADDRCKPTGKKCKKNKQCCSGNCSGGTCAACPTAQVLCNGSCVSTSCSTGTGQSFNTSTCQCECPTGKVKLSNGTCATPCTTAPECPNCVCIGASVNPNFSRGFCGTPNPGSGCATDDNCPTGQFCAEIFGGTSCVPAC